MKAVYDEFANATVDEDGAIRCCRQTEALECSMIGALVFCPVDIADGGVSIGGDREEPSPSVLKLFVLLVRKRGILGVITHFWGKNRYLRNDPAGMPLFMLHARLNKEKQRPFRQLPVSSREVAEVL